MTLKNAFTIFESLVSETNKKSDIKIYQEFIQIIKGLENKNLSESEILSIEMELDNLNIESNPENRKKYFKRTLSNFKKYLKDTFNLTTKRYYTELGIALGASFGILFGVVFLSSWERSMGISLGLIIGSGIGGAIGRSMDYRAKAAGKVL